MLSRGVAPGCVATGLQPGFLGSGCGGILLCEFGRRVPSAWARIAGSSARQPGYDGREFVDAKIRFGAHE
ncbi:MAG: hypothetical protein ACFCU6_11135 [Balneolaceae bacterium]